MKAFQWLIEALPNGRYRLRARGAPVGESEGLLFAFLVEQGEDTEWVITGQGSNGLYTYVHCSLFCVTKLMRTPKGLRSLQGKDGSGRMDRRCVITHRTVT
jgi:hypothetical protein